jgi:hypothetical protein
VEALDKLTKQLLCRYKIPYNERNDVAQVIAIGWIEGSRKCADGGWLYKCCQHKVVDWLRREFGWSRRISLDEERGDDDGTLMDVLCCHRATPYQALNAKQQVIVDTDIDAQLVEYEKRHKPFGTMKLKEAASCRRQ